MAMSLFNETVARLNAAESELKTCRDQLAKMTSAFKREERRCRDLEMLLRQEQAKHRPSYQGAKASIPCEVNSLSDEETDRLFAQVRPEFKVTVRVVPWWERFIWWRA